MIEPHPKAIPDTGPPPDSPTEAILTYLVDCQTVAGNTEPFTRAFNYLEHTLRSCGLTVVRLTHNGHESLLASTRADGLWRPTVCIGAHLDVVAAAPEMFTLTSDSEAFHGRGVFDMKWVLVSMLRLAGSVQDDRERYSLGFMVTSDEELGGADGTEWLLEQGYQPTMCILPDAGSCDHWNIETHAKGALKMRARAVGRAAHGSRPWEGDNAIWKLVNFLADIKSLYQEQGPDTTTVNIGTIAGGDAVNQVAPWAEAALDVRFMTEQDRKKVMTHIRELAALHSVDVTLERDGMVHRVDLNSPIGQMLVDSMRDVVNYEPPVVKNLGASDARYFDQYGTPCFVVGPRGGGHHGIDEWVAREAADEFADMARRFTLKMTHG